MFYQCKLGLPMWITKCGSVESIRKIELSSISPEFLQNLGRLESNIFSEIQDSILLKEEQIPGAEFLVPQSLYRLLNHIARQEHLEQNHEEEEDRDGANPLEVI